MARKVAFLTDLYHWSEHMPSAPTATKLHQDESFLPGSFFMLFFFINVLSLKLEAAWM